MLHTVIQALSGITDKRLLPYYKQIAKRFPEEKDYILSNLERRLATFGLTIEEARKWKTKSKVWKIETNQSSSSI